MLQIFLIIVAASLITAQTFNDVCTTDANCDESKILICDTVARRCICRNSAEQIFDQNADACVARVGFYCDHEGEEGLHCVDGGYCNAYNLPNGTHVHECACNAGWTATQDLYCNKTTTYDDACTTDTDCNESQILKCDTVTRKCGCRNPNEQIFDQNQQACVARVGFSCDHEGEEGLHCVDGGYCNAYNNPDGEHVHECACKLGWVANDDLFCENPTGYDDVCSSDADCNTAKLLKCDTASQKCVCLKPDEQIFDQRRQICVSRVGFTCDHDGPLVCVQGAYCDMPIINGVMQHRCKCNNGLTLQEDNTCSGAHLLFQITSSLLLLLTAFIIIRIA